MFLQYAIVYSGTYGFRQSGLSDKKSQNFPKFPQISQNHIGSQLKNRPQTAYHAVPCSGQQMPER